MVHYVWMKLNVNIYLKVIGGLNIIGNTSEIFMKNLEKSCNVVIPEKC